jgi:aspartate racemase
VDASIKEIRKRSTGGQTVSQVGLLGTQGTISTGFLRKRLEEDGCCQSIMLDELSMSSWVYPAITLVKLGGSLDGPAKLLSEAVSALRRQGADWVVLACTELPLLLEHFDDQSLAEICIDPCLALAQECVQWWEDAQQPQIVMNTEQPEQA